MSGEKQVREIGDRVRAKYRSFFSEQSDKLHFALVPMIEVDGKLMGIFDETTISGQLEAPNRYQALKLARQIRDDAKERLIKKNVKLDSRSTQTM